VLADDDATPRRGGVDLLQEFLTAYDAAYAQLQQRFADGAIESRFTYPNGIVHRFRHASRGARVRLDEYHYRAGAADPHVHVVWLYDGEKLTCALEQESGAYGVLNIERGQRETLLKQLQSKCPAPYAAFCCHEMQISDFLRAPGCEVRAASKEGDLLRLQWSCRADKEFGETSTRVGSFLFDPRNQFALREFTARLAEDPRQTEFVRTVEYDDDGAISAVRDEVHYRAEGHSRSGGSATGIVTSRELPPDELFRLSSLGLPDDLGAPAAPRRESSLWLVLALNGFALFLIGGCLLRRRQRRSAGGGT